VVPGTLLDPVVPALIRYLVGGTIADWLEVPRSGWDSVAKVTPAALGLLESLEDRGLWASQLSNRLGRMISALQLTSLTQGRVMHHAIPDDLKTAYHLKDRPTRWTPPPSSFGDHGSPS